MSDQPSADPIHAATSALGPYAFGASVVLLLLAGLGALVWSCDNPAAQCAWACGNGGGRMAALAPDGTCTCTKGPTP